MEPIRFPEWNPECGCPEHEWEDRCREVHGADIIIVHDTKNDMKAIVYGRKLLEHIVRTGHSENAQVATFAVNIDTYGLEQLCALVSVLKGVHDDVDGRWYKASDFPFG